MLAGGSGSAFGFIGWVIAVVLVAEVAPAANRDVPGSADHPLVGRFEQSWIGGYKAAEFDEATIATGPVAAADENVKRLEGRVTRIAYHAPGDISPLELYRNFRQKLAGSGFETIFECVRKEECGAGLVKATPLLNLPAMWHGADHRYLAAKKPRPEEGDVWLSLFCEPLGGSGKNACQVTIVETRAMQYRMIDAAAMAVSISERGSVALYGLYFDTDEASIKLESQPTLLEIAALLKDKKDLKVVIVGHTDNEGSLEYNMDLSKRRAESVRRALTGEHGIEASRLEAWGAGYLAPVTSNRTEDGRAKNRRVELVER